MQNPDQTFHKEDFLLCKYCGGKSVLEGTWAKGKVRCLTCGIERPAKEYEEEIEKLKEAWISGLGCKLSK